MYAMLFIKHKNSVNLLTGFLLCFDQLILNMVLGPLRRGSDGMLWFERSIAVI